MARIRSIHPGIFTDEAFMSLTVDCPLAVPMLLGVWAEADDAGAFEWKPLTLKARILPAAACNVPALLAVLVEANFIKRFEIDGRSIGVIRNFVKFQRPKAPVDSHPFTSESRSFAGFERDGKRPHSGTGRPPAKDSSEPLPNLPETTSEVSPQMKDVGCRMEEEEDKSDITSSVDQRLVRLKTGITSAFLEVRSMTLNPDTAKASVWLAQGYDPDLCLAVVRDVLSRKPNVSSLGYFDPAIIKAHAERTQKIPAAASEQLFPIGAVRWPERAIVNALNIWKEKRVWMDNIGPPPGHKDCQVPRHLIEQLGIAA